MRRYPMKEYIKFRIAKINTAMPKDDQFSAMHSIYNDLEERGYKTYQIKTLIDEVIFENLRSMYTELNSHLDEIKKDCEDLADNMDDK